MEKQYCVRCFCDACVCFICPRSVFVCSAVGWRMWMIGQRLGLPVDCLQPPGMFKLTWSSTLCQMVVYLYRGSPCSPIVLFLCIHNFFCGLSEIVSPVFELIKALSFKKTIMNIIGRAKTLSRQGFTGGKKGEN